MSFRKMTPKTIQSFLAGNSLVLRTVIPHKVAKKYPSEVSLLMDEFDMVLAEFQKRVKGYESEEESKKVPENKKSIIHKIMKDNEEGRYK